MELDGFSSVAGSELAALFRDTQTGQSQTLFQLSNDRHDTVTNLGNHDSLTPTNVHIADLHANDFIVR